MPILNTQRVYNSATYVVDYDPSDINGEGLVAGLNSVATLSPGGEVFVKTGLGDYDWTLVVAGAVLGSFSGVNAAKMLTSTYTALPVIIYDWSRRPQEAFRADAAAGIVVLLVAVLAVNAAAIVLRARFERNR